MGHTGLVTGSLYFYLLIFIILWDHSSCMPSVVDRNVVMRGMTVSCSPPLLYGVMISEWYMRTGRNHCYAFVSFVCIKTWRYQTHVQAARDFLLVSRQNKWFGLFPEHDSSQAVIQKAMTSGHMYLEGSGKENKQQDRLLSGGVTFHGWKIGFVVPKNRLYWSSLLNHNDMKPSPDTMRYVNVLLDCLIP